MATSSSGPSSSVVGGALEFELLSGHEEVIQDFLLGLDSRLKGLIEGSAAGVLPGILDHRRQYCTIQNILL